MSATKTFNVSNSINITVSENLVSLRCDERKLIGEIPEGFDYTI